MTAIQRECKEELGWVPNKLERALDFFVDGELIAWFWQPTGDSAGGLRFEDTSSLRFEHNVTGIWLPQDELSTNEVSDWHRCVLEEWLQGKKRAEFVTLKEG